MQRTNRGMAAITFLFNGVNTVPYHDLTTVACVHVLALYKTCSDFGLDTCTIHKTYGN